LRYFNSLGDDRLLLLNLGPAQSLEVVPEPLLAPPTPGRWKLLWSSEAPEYGGPGAVAPESKKGWTLPAESALILRPEGNA
jgi:maltooligosyltrehalose trehalohydrolase